MLENGKYRTRNRKKYIEKEPLQMTDEEIKKVFISPNKPILKKTDNDEFEIFLLERSKLKERKEEEIAENKIDEQIEIKI